MPLTLAKLDPQALGSAITYLRRYSLAAMVRVAPDDDDDGEKAQQAFRVQQQQAKPTLSHDEVNKMTTKLLSHFHPEDRTFVIDYVEKHSKANNCTIPESIEKLLVEDALNKFKAGFTAWKEKQKSVE